MKFNNEYMAAYLTDLNKASVKKTIKNVNKKKNNLIIQNKRKSVKSKLLKSLILQQNESQKEVNCKIRLLSKVSTCDESGKPNDLTYFPVALFGNGKFEIQQPDSSKVQELKSKIKGIIDNAYSEALEDENIKAKLEDKNSKNCLVCFLIIAEDKPDNSITEYILTTNYLNKVALVIPNDRDWFQSVKVDMHKLTELHNKDGVLKALDFTLSMPLDILSVIWQGAKTFGSIAADLAKDVCKNSIIGKFFNDMFDDTDYNAETKKIIHALTSFVKSHKEQFSKLSKELQNKILFTIGDEKGKPVAGLINYKAILDNDDKIKPQQFNDLKILFEQVKNNTTAAEALQQAKNDPSVMDQFSDKEKANALKKQINNPIFNKTCKQLGFKDKKKKGGLAALFEKILNGIMNIFGGGDDDPKEINDSSAIRDAMPFIKDAIKAIPPGKYPVYFGGNKVDIAEMEKRFKETNKQ